VSDPISAQALGAAISTTKELATPVLADLVGVAGGDWLHHVRIRSASRLEARTREILEKQGIGDHFEEVSPAFLEPLVQSASNEIREELLDLWARLLAAAADPKKAATVRKSFIIALQQFDPIDAPIFQKLWEIGIESRTPSKRDDIARELRIGIDVVGVSFENLFQQRCVMNPSGGPLPGADPALSSFGRELARALFA
jgi:hypothetical protein